MKRLFPILDWSRDYRPSMLASDLSAAVIVTIMLIPQSLAYALLAGLPAEVGLYASILPLLAYALFGTSRTLAVGPVAIVSLMTATAIGALGPLPLEDKLIAAAALAGLSGLFLVAMGALRLGLIANFLSHPVISGFITASALLIALSQARHILGIAAHGHTLPELLPALAAHLPETSLPTLAIGAASLGFLVWARQALAPLLIRAGLAPGTANALARAAPVLAVVLSIAITKGLALDRAGVAIVGAVPGGLPPFALPMPAPETLRALLLPALLISIIGFVESVSVAQTLAARRRQRIRPDQELIALGAANLSAGITGGYPVTGGFARSVVNFDAGAVTPAAGAFTALGILAAATWLTPLLHFLPKAVLGATIIVAVLSLVDLSALRNAWRQSRTDFAAVMTTIAVTLLIGVEAGVGAGVVLSILMHLLRTARPHVAEVGRVPGTEHFRNILRHEVETHPHLVTLRVDESLYFANAAWLRDMVLDRVREDAAVTDVVLMMSAVNAIDLSALESLEEINATLRDQGIRLHLSEVKGPVMDWLRRGRFCDHLTGRIFLSQHEAFRALSP